ncbi:relaxin-3b [Poeciliopsis prolifica]|uniref:relaxin-3b n=1 Tax=Poeciliopsis prolifica TaxID=188132 RepID=UPI002413940F|nr:relaxin-3b [Poeciliopsis prolifica]
MRPSKKTKRKIPNHRDIHSVTMLKGALLTLGLFMIFVHLAQCADSHSSLYGVKLCGREFIRAVIFTCGGSRWRRSVEDSGLIGEEILDPWQANQIPQLSVQDPANSQALKDQVMNAVGFSRSARSPLSEELLEALQGAGRKGREAEFGLSNACCKWGCSKSEISSLC